MSVFFVFASIFWGAFEQAGSTLNLFADRYTRLSVLGFAFPASWFQSVPPTFVIMVAPAFTWLWVRLGPREPSSPAKFTLGPLFVGLSFLLLVPAATAAQSAAGVRVSPLWLVGVYFLQELGRSEEHTSELQSRLHLVCRLLLEKKNHGVPWVNEQ